MHKQYLTKMDDTFEAIDGFVTKMSRQIRDLDDVRFAMEALKVILYIYQSLFLKNRQFSKIFIIFFACIALFRNY